MTSLSQMYSEAHTCHFMSPSSFGLQYAGWAFELHFVNFVVICICHTGLFKLVNLFPET